MEGRSCGFLTSRSSASRNDGDASLTEARRRTQSRLGLRQFADQLRHRLVVFGNHHFVTGGQLVDQVRQFCLCFLNRDRCHFSLSFLLRVLGVLRGCFRSYSTTKSTKSTKKITLFRGHPARSAVANCCAAARSILPPAKIHVKPARVPTQSEYERWPDLRILADASSTRAALGIARRDGGHGPAIHGSRPSVFSVSSVVPTLSGVRSLR